MAEDVQYLSNTLRALSWKEPYATLMLHGKIETRKWKTDYRGLVLICATQKPFAIEKIKNIAGDEQYIRIVKLYYKYKYRLSRSLGNAIATGELVDCRPMTERDEDACFVQWIEPWFEEVKLASGNTKTVKKQLWCHIYENIKPIEPFVFKGKQGWKKLNNSFMERIKYL